LVQHVPRIQTEIGANDQGDGQAIEKQAGEELDQAMGHKSTGCAKLAIENRASYAILA
jgi:hypothetical protein